MNTRTVTALVTSLFFALAAPGTWAADDPLEPNDLNDLHDLDENKVVPSGEFAHSNIKSATTKRECRDECFTSKKDSFGVEHCVVYQNTCTGKFRMGPGAQKGDFGGKRD